MNKNEIHFYYNREKRLEKASQRVRDLYETQPRRRFAFFSSLTDTKPKAFTFIAIVIMSLMILFVTYLVPDSSTRLGKNEISISVMRYNDSSFIVLKKKALRSAKTGIVDVVITPKGAAQENGKTLVKRQIVFDKSETEEFRWNVPIDAPEFVFYLQLGDEQTVIHAASQ
ncbi:MAG: hypothetical protein LBG79_08600 [Spirochaetaceae bacterium]|nr:hypothetical protein [Spirochaetaceae bacterium]